MKELGLRALTGAVYVLLTLGAAWAGPVTTFLLYLPVCLIGLHEMHRLLRQPTEEPPTTWTMLVGATVYLAVGLHAVDQQWNLGYTLALSFLMLLITITWSLWRGQPDPGQAMGQTLCGLLLVAVPFGLMTHFFAVDRWMFIGFMILLWTNDTGAYLVGRAIGRTPLFRVLVITSLVMPFFALPVQQILPVFSEQVFERGPSALGILIGATGVGGIIGALASASLEEYERKNRLMLLGVLVMGGCYLAFALSSFFWLAVAFLVVGSVGRMLFMVTNNTVIQARVPDAYRGRVMSVLMMSFGTMPLGVLPLTIAADALGPQVAVAALSVLVLITMLSAFVFSTTLRNLRLTPLEERDLSPAQAARMVAEGELTQQEADEITGRDTSAVSA